MTDPDGMILRANARAGRLFHCAVEDLIGELVPDLIRPADRPAFRAFLSRFETADPEGEWLGQAVPASGPPFRGALTATVVRHADDTPYGVRWSIRDIGRRPVPD